MPAPKRSASPARKRAKLVSTVPFPLTQSPVLAVPTLATGISAEPGLCALKLPAKVTSAGPKTSGVVFLRGVLHSNPAHPTLSEPYELFTLPAGMRPASDGHVIATFRQQGPAPVEAVILRIYSGGQVCLTGGDHGFSYDSMIWLDGISFVV